MTSDPDPRLVSAAALAADRSFDAHRDAVRFWRELGYQYAYATESAKRAAGIPRFWRPGPALAAYIEGRDARRAEQRPSGEVAE